MNVRVAPFLAVAVVLGVSWTPVQADLYDFTIQGTYAETLMSPPPPGGPNPAVTLFEAGDAFTIQGVYDRDAQPQVETRDGGLSVLPDETVDLSGFIIVTLDYCAITELTFTDMPLGLISHYYPSDPGAMNVDDIRNGAYAAHANFISQQFVVEAYDDFTRLYVSKSIVGSDTAYSAFIDYGYYTATYGSGDLSYTKTLFDTIDLNIDSIEICDHVVPLPSSAILLASAMATVAGFRKKLRAKGAV